MINLHLRWIYVAAFFLLTNFVFAQSEVLSNPTVSQPINMGVSQAMRDMPLTTPKTIENWINGIIPLRKAFNSEVIKVERDGSVLEYNGPFGVTGITKNFNGVGAGGYAPPDASGDVGPNHYVQMVNVQTQIWDKNGNSLAGPFDNSNFWAGLPGPWSGSNDGDPIVLYDEIANRWMVSQFALPNYPNGPFYILIAVSTTADPTGSYYQYAYSFPNMPDYPKFGIWPDGYYMTANVFASGTGNYSGTYAAVFDRNTMLAGGTATMQYFSNSTATWSLLPADCDGVFPAVGTPNYFLATYNGSGTGNTNLDIYQFHVDWVTPANSTFTGPTFITTPAFSEADPSPQLGTTQTLDNLSDRPMNRLQYRNFGSYETMVVCQTVNAGSGRAGMRWWELQKSTGSWGIYQEGTYAPSDGLYRWMGSIAMDENGSIALGYSTSGSTIHPDIRFTGRFASDPLGVMTMDETVIYAGAGSQTSGLSRWGDYTQMVVDPTASGTFWYTNQYIPSNGTFNWNTRIAAFNFSAPCPVGYPSSPNPVDGATNVSANLPQLSWTNGAGSVSSELYFGSDPLSLSLVQSGGLYSSWNITSLPLEYSTKYYWQVVNANDTCSNSNPVVWNFTTEADPNIVTLFTEPFPNFNNWTAVGPLGMTNWTIESSNNAGGTAPELQMDYDPSFNGTSKIRSIVITVPSNTELSLSFQWALDWYSNPSGTIGIAATYDGGTTSSTIWSVDNPTANVGPENILTSFTTPTLTESANLQLEIFFTGNSFNIDYIYFDDIVLHYIVPVELTSFTANVLSNTVNLKWNTATELNNSGFEIQRKADNSDFVKVGYVAGFGTTTEPKAYSFIEKDLASGNYTYRLKQVDFNGSFEYSNEINVEVVAPVKYSLDQNYPNPFNPSTLIKYSVAKDGFVNVSVFNLIGEKVATLVNGNVKAGSYEVNFNASSFSSGVYFYSIEAGDFKAVRKMMLMK